MKNILILSLIIVINNYASGQTPDPNCDTNFVPSFVYPTQEEICNIDVEYVLVVNYSKSVKQLIALSNYGLYDENITDRNYPRPETMIGKELEFSAKLFNFNKNMTSKNILAKISQAGYRPATLFELLAFGLTYPEKQKQLQIVALGSIRNGAGNFPTVPALYASGEKRTLKLIDYNDFGWDGQYYFLAVSK